MPVSVEARGVQVGDRLSDLILSAAHVPEDLDPLEFQAFVARTLDVPSTSIVTTADIGDARRVLEPRWEWDGEISSLSERCLQAIALGNFGRGADGGWPFLPMHPFRFEELYYRRRRFAGRARSNFAIEAASRLDWPPLSDDDEDRQITADLELMFGHELALGQSPKVKPYTIRELVQSPRALVLVPAAAGAFHSAATIGMNGSWTVALLSAATGAGSTIILGAGVWLADKLLAGVKHLHATPRRELPPGRARRKPPGSSEPGSDDSA